MIAESGVTCVWLPPPSDSVSPQGYLPRDLYDLNSAYGNEVRLCSQKSFAVRKALKVWNESACGVWCDVHVAAAAPATGVSPQGQTPFCTCDLKVPSARWPSR